MMSAAKESHQGCSRKRVSPLRLPFGQPTREASSSEMKEFIENEGRKTKDEKRGQKEWDVAERRGLTKANNTSARSQEMPLGRICRFRGRNRGEAGVERRGKNEERKGEGGEVRRGPRGDGGSCLGNRPWLGGVEWGQRENSVVRCQNPSRSLRCGSVQWR